MEVRGSDNLATSCGRDKTWLGHGGSGVALWEGVPAV